MTKQQKRILLVGGVLIALRLVFPVMKYRTEIGDICTCPLFPLITTCSVRTGFDLTCRVLDMPRTISQVVAIGVVMAIAIYTNKEQK